MEIFPSHARLPQPKRRTAPQAVVIVLTARAVEHEKMAPRGAGATDFVIRPRGIEDLMARICARLHAVRPGP